MTRERAEESLNGRMVEFMTENGKMENNMESVRLHPKISKLKKENGLMEKKLDGLIENLINQWW
jgi:hypothetical protein